MKEVKNPVSVVTLAWRSDSDASHWQKGIVRLFTFLFLSLGFFKIEFYYLLLFLLNRFDTNIPEALCMVCFVDDIMPRGDFTWYPCVQLDVRFFFVCKETKVCMLIPESVREFTAITQRRCRLLLKMHDNFNQI